jgi:CRP-like cAMP-binding protein
MALIADQPRAATVRGKVATDLLVLERTDFQRLVKRQPEIERMIAATAAARRAALADLALVTAPPTTAPNDAQPSGSPT